MAQHATTPTLTSQDFFTTTLTSGVAIGDTVINIAAVPSGSEGFLVIDPNTPASREVIYYTSKTSSSVTCPDATQGSSRGLGGTTVQTHASGTAVELRSVAEYWLALQNGQSLTGLHTYFTEGLSNYVASGCVWSGDSYGSTLNGSMTSGVVYIAGRRYTVSAVTAHAFTLSKDTYVDVTPSASADGTATVGYSAVANNAASPALAASSIRIAIVVSGATSIAAAASINQGSPQATLPVASSVIYSVCDSLGNLIYPTTPNPVLVGYRQITTDATQASTSATAVAALSLTLTVPVGRRVRLTLMGDIRNQNTGDGVAVTIWDGTVGSGTRLAYAQYGNSSTTDVHSPINLSAIVAPGATKTYNVGLNAVTAGTAVIQGGSTNPAFLSAEYI